MLTTRAPAKVNLTLVVLGRRMDGYHDLSSLVAFAGVGDTLSLEPDQPLGLGLGGPFAHQLDGSPGNLVLRAAQHLADLTGTSAQGHFSLIKRLPIASGIGGGSADAAAAIRLICRARGLAPDDARVLAAARATGADVPVCLASKARMMRGSGEVLGAPLKLPGLFAVLVNPGVGVATASVFAALGLAPGDRHRPDEGVQGALASKASSTSALIREVLEANGNDLEPPAMRLVPAIGDVLEALRAAPGCWLARMSGSGATCFGLFGDCRQSANAARAIKATQAGWWAKATVLR